MIVEVTINTDIVPDEIYCGYTCKYRYQSEFLCMLFIEKLAVDIKKKEILALR